MIHLPVVQESHEAILLFYCFGVVCFGLCVLDKPKFGLSVHVKHSELNVCSKVAV